jgi:hypothetical protein
MDNTERIRQRAHQIWEAEGRPEGRQAEHWAQAEGELQRDNAMGDDMLSGGNPDDGLSELPAELVSGDDSHADGRIVEAGESGIAGGPDEAEEALESPVYPEGVDRR